MTSIIRPVSDHALLLDFSREPDGRRQTIVERWFQVLRHERQALELLTIQPGYDSILVKFDPLKFSHAQIEQKIRNLHLDHGCAPVTSSADEGESESQREPGRRTISIPICYEPPFALDLATVAIHSGLAESEIIKIHSSTVYTVQFLGFMPGFAYLSGLPKELATPRLAAARTLVPAGSLGIAGLQTGIYPLSSPGGWQIIGRTPIKLFSPDWTEPTLLGVGDRVKFEAIGAAEFSLLELEERPGKI